MAKLSPYCPSGTVSFCQTFTPVRWSTLSEILETEEALHEYAKFRSSLMDTFTSLTMSIASDNEVLMGWYCSDELKRLEKYNVAASIRSSSLMKHDADLHQLLGKVEGFSCLTDQVGRNVKDYSFHLKKLHSLHQFFAYRKGLAKHDFIKCNSDFSETFQRLKSEKPWTGLPDHTLRLALAQHFSLLRKLNDDLGMIGLANKIPEGSHVQGSVRACPTLVEYEPRQPLHSLPIGFELDALTGAIPELMRKTSQGDKLLEAINNEYSQGLSDLIKEFKERTMKRFFSEHMEVKILQRKRFDQAESSRTAIIPKECHFTSPKLSPLIDRALVHRSRALEKLLEVKDRWGRSIGGLRSILLPAAVLFAGIPFAYGMQKR